MNRAQSARLVLLGAVLVVGLALWWVLPQDGGAAPASGGPAASPSAVTLTATSDGAVAPAGTAGSTGRTTTATTTATTRAGARTTRPAAAADLRTKALAVLAVVDSTGEPPAGYVGGRRFMNDGRGGTAPLPRHGAGGATVVYHEYDVNPYRQGVDRGPQRLVVGDDGSAWCTGDHYVSWTRLR